MIYKVLGLIFHIYWLFNNSKVDSLTQSTKKNIDKVYNFIDKVHCLTFLNRKGLQKVINTILFITFLDFNIYLCLKRLFTRI
jgi:hypothetical protein